MLLQNRRRGAAARRGAATRHRARGDRSERDGRDDPGRRQRARVARSRRSRRSPGCGALRRRVRGRARARLLELQADAGARHDGARRSAAGRVLRGPRARRRAGARSSPATAAGSRSPGRSRPRCPTSSRCGSRARSSRPRSGDVDVRRSCRSAGRGSRSTARSSSTTGNPTGRSEAFMGFGERGGDRARSTLVAGERARARGRVRAARAVDGWARIGCTPPAPPDLLDRAVALAAPRRRGRVRRRAPTTTGRPRATIASRWRCRRRRTSSCARSRRVNPRTIVVVNAASPVDMAWADDVSARSCSAGSRARSGATRSPTCCRATCRRRASCRPRSRCASRTRPRSRAIRASGARCATAKACSSATAGTTRGDIEPRFCFGHGLSYTTFDARRAAVGVGPRRCRRRACASRAVRNTGARRGAEVVQCYVRDVEASVARPRAGAEGVRARSGSIPAQPATSRSSSTSAPSRSGTSTPHAWTVEPGEFELRIGTSSRDIAHRLTIDRGERR